VIEPLPELLDCAKLMKELGIKRASAEKIMRRLPVVEFENLRRTYVKREDVAAYLDACTSAGEWRFVKT
jgi:hypothetical protein